MGGDLPPEIQKILMQRFNPRPRMGGDST